MSNQKMFSIYDTKAKVYNIPFSARTTEEALRMFERLASDKNSMISQFPSDYVLFEVGSFSQDDGKIVSVTPHSIANAGEYFPSPL